MPFDDKKWDRPAVQGSVGALALAVSISLDSIRSALENIKSGNDITNQLDEIHKQSRKLDKMFDDLTGYYSDAR